MTKFKEWLDHNRPYLEAAYKALDMEGYTLRAWELAQPQWQPIETAPENTLIIVRNWDGHIWEVTLEAHCEEEKNWYLHDETLLNIDPTHWMPLPEAPKEDGKYAPRNRPRELLSKRER